MPRSADRLDYPKSDLRSLALTLSVSLFMVLLAFFLVLNSYATESEHKLSLARDSITDTFGLIAEGRAAVDTQSEGEGAAGDMEMTTSAALRSVLPDVGLQTRNGPTGHVMSVTLPRAQVEDRWFDLRSRLSDLLTNLNPGGRYRLQIISHDQNAVPSDLASMAANLEEDGVDPELLSVGIEANGRDAIELRFVGRGS